MRSYIVSLGLMLAAGALPATPTVAQEESADAVSTARPMPPPVKPSAFGKPDKFGDGQRIVVKDGDFSIKPPAGWEVFTQLDNLSLLMQVPYKPGMRYQRTIQVASFSEPRFIDDLTAREYENVIVQKFSAISSAISEYRVRNHMTVDMFDGRKGLLFYTEFKLEGVSLMQAHILVSSATRHYLMTFTDLAEHFESDDAGQFLTEAWNSMISVELGTKTPQRFELFAAAGVAIVALVILGFAFATFRAWRSGRRYQAYANGRDLDDDPVSGAGESFTSGAGASDVQSLAASEHASGDGAEDDPITKDDIAV